MSVYRVMARVGGDTYLAGENLSLSEAVELGRQVEHGGGWVVISRQDDDRCRHGRPAELACTYCLESVDSSVERRSRRHPSMGVAA